MPDLLVVRMLMAVKAADGKVELNDFFIYVPQTRTRMGRLRPCYPIADDDDAPYVGTLGLVLVSLLLWAVLHIVTRA